MLSMQMSILALNICPIFWFGLIEMLGDRSRIRKVAIVENGETTLPKALVKMAVGLPNVLFAAFFAFSEIAKVFGFTV